MNRIPVLLLWLIYWAPLSGHQILQAQPLDSKPSMEYLRKVPARAKVSFGKVERWEGFNFHRIVPRTVELWLPPQPYWDQRSPLPVWYLHDGQNILDPSLSYGGSSWELDSLMEVHLRQGRIPPCILVLVDNSPKRFEEYLPPPCLDGLEDTLRMALHKERPGTALGDEYARWIVEELMPWIMIQYPVKQDAGQHYLMGASMGGLISSYIAVKYPKTFGGAVCLSTHWPLSLRFNDIRNSEPYRRWLGQQLDSIFAPRDHNPSEPTNTLHSLYMDLGDQTLDAFYPPHQKAFDLQMQSWIRHASSPTLRYKSNYFPGTRHHEQDWSARCIQAMAWVMQGQHKIEEITPPKSGNRSKKYAHSNPLNWQVYFAMTDRFADGNTRNNLQPTYDLKREHYFHGGDFEGIRQSIPYLKSLGINALWITPPVKNQDFNPDSSLTGYHGYWASHFGKTDPRWGSKRAYHKMAKALNQNGIALIQDVVVNHTGDYFDIDSAGKFRAWNLDKPLQGYLRKWPVDTSSSWRSSIYHRTGPITDYNDSLQRLTGQMSGLDDLNTSNPLVQRRLKKDYHRWIKSGGLRGMRFDTPLYVEHDFWKNFLKGMPVYSFGELWTHSPAWSDRGERLAASYVMPGQGIDAALQFPLQKTILEVLDGTRSSAHLSYRLSVERLHFPNPLQRVHFLDNHDMPRISTRLDSLQIAQALLLLYSMPGIPVLYYGTESALKGSRDDYFDAVQRPGPYREWIRALSHLRYQEKALREGLTEVVLDSRMGTSIWMAWIDRRWMIALNLSKHQISIPDSLIRAALPLLTRRAHQPMLQCGPAGSWDRDSLVMNPGEAWIWAVHTQENLLNQISAPLPAQSLGFEAWSSIEPILRNSTLVAEFPDPPGDDSGSNGQIQYPKAFDGRPGDIRGLRWLHSDAGYVLEIQMQEPLSTLWNPPHGMDHVNLHISLNAPTLLEFHLDGWNASGSTTWEWFTDAGQGKIYALFPRGSMVSPSTITVQTWDSDGNGEPRTLSLNPGAYEFRGDPSTEKWIDKAFLTLDP